MITDWSDERIRDRLAGLNADDSRRILLRGGTILSMDPAVGDHVRGDVLIDGDRITAVGPALDAAGGELVMIDATGMVVLPGFQDTHRHCWQTQLRRHLVGVDFGEYVAAMHRAIAPRYRPEDVYAGNLLAAIGAVDSGVTSLLDFSHNCRSAAHADAGVQGHLDGGVRAVYAYGPPQAGTWDEQWPHDISRIVQTSTPGEDRVTFRMAVMADPDLFGPKISLTPGNIALARSLGVGIIADAAVGPAASANVERLGRAGLLGPDVTLIHCNDFTDGAWHAIAASGTRVSLCPTSDPQIRLAEGVPPIQPVLDLDVTAGLSVDVESCLSTSMFAQMQAIYTIQRMSAAANGAPAPMTVRRVLELATIGGARVNGLAAITGSLTPGRRADIVLITAEDVNTAPLNNAVATVVLGADTRNVDTVLVDGRVRKFRGSLIGLDFPRARDLARGSRDHLLAALGQPLDVLS